MSTELEEAWSQHYHRHDFPALAEGWTPYPSHVRGWNTHQLLPVVVPEEGLGEVDCTTDEANNLYRAWCEAYFHAVLRKEGKTAALAAKELCIYEEQVAEQSVHSAAAANTKADAKEKYFAESVQLGSIPAFRKQFQFDTQVEARANNDSVLGVTHDPFTARQLAATTTKKQKKNTNNAPYSRELQQALAEKRALAQSRWTKLASHTKLTLLQDSIVKCSSCGDSYCSYRQPFSAQSRYVCFDYDLVDAAVDAFLNDGYSAEMSLTDCADTLLRPYRRTSWRCSEEQGCHHSFRSAFRLLTKLFKKKPDEVDAAFTLQPGAIAAAWAKKEANAYELAHIFATFCGAEQTETAPPPEGVPSDGISGATVKVVKGKYRKGIDSSGYPLPLGNCAWNLVSWNEKKYFVDCFGGIDSEFYWLTPTPAFISEHYPEKTMDQLSTKAVARSAWEVSPCPRHVMYTHGLSLVSHVKYAHIVAKSPPLTVQFEMVDTTVDVTALLFEGPLSEQGKTNRELPPGHVWQERMLATSTLNLHMVLPDTGLYTLEVYVQRSDEDAPQLAVQYQISSSVKVGEDPLLPAQCVPPATAVLDSPGMGKLAAGGQAEFVVFPCRADIEGAMLVERVRPAASESKKGKEDGEGSGALRCEYHVMAYDALRGAFARTLPQLRRGVVDVYLRMAGSFVPAFTGFNIVTAISSKEDMDGVPLIPRLPPSEVAEISRFLSLELNTPQSKEEAERTVGAYFAGR